VQHRDIRWQQRFKNFCKAFKKLEEAVLRMQTEFYSNGILDLRKLKVGDDLVREGLIQRFEYTHELSWNVMKDFLSEKGNVELYGSKDATKAAFDSDLIHEGEVWMDMIQSRNKSLHTYNEEIADKIFELILEEYYPAFVDFKETMEKKLAPNS
jgi:nucleotidyltransferase substrate binding protein (TIGR01987 family)